MPVQFVEICTYAMGTKKKQGLTLSDWMGMGAPKKASLLKVKVKAKSD